MILFSARIMTHMKDTTIGTIFMLSWLYLLGTLYESLGGVFLDLMMVPLYQR